MRGKPEIKYDVFISYSRKDYVDGAGNILENNVISRIKDTFRANGISYWFDEEGIYSGQEFTSVITGAIRTSAVFVFISSKNSNASLWTSNEIAIAKRLNKPIIPFCIDESPYNDSVMMLIAALDYVDGRDSKVAYNKLIRAIRHYKNADNILLETETGDDKNEETLVGNMPWYERFVNPSFSLLQKLLVYFQLCVYTLSFLFVIWTSLFGALAVYNHFQLSQLFLMLTLGISIFATIKLRSGKVIWWAIIGICDFLEALYVSVLAKYLFVHWNSFSKLGLPTSIRYGWLYSMGEDLGDHYFLHPTLIFLVILHIILICLSYNKGSRKRLGSAFLMFIIVVPLIIFLKSDQIVRMWYDKVMPSQYPTLDMKELSTGKLYGMHEAVDLGLSVKWATCNIGAKAPHESGEFFAWGESYTKDFFDWRSYKYGDCSYSNKDLKKYCTNSVYGAVDNLTVLCDSDDAARRAWGNGWRMPTYDEISELKENCTFEIKSFYGVNGVAVTGPNKKIIFIPFAGDVEGNKNLPGGEGTYAILWSSSLNEENDYAYELAFSIADNMWYRGPRFTGHNIRAVHE